MASDRTGVELDVILTGTVPIPAAYVFRGTGAALIRTAGLLRNALVPGGKMLKSPCLAYVIRHPSAGTLLVDTGFHPDATSDRRRDFGAAMSLVFRSLDAADQPYVDQLRRLGVDPDAPLRVLMTHLHVDHTSGMRLLPRAMFSCSKAEWEAAHTERAALRGYVARHLPPESRLDLIDFAEHGEPHGPFAETLDLLGDGSILLISTPGHTNGHMSMLLRCIGGRQVLIVGDAAYTLRSIREGLLPLLTADDQRYARSLAELKAFMEHEPEAIVVPSHDPDAWRRLPDVAPAAESAAARA